MVGACPLTFWVCPFMLPADALAGFVAELGAGELGGCPLLIEGGR